MDKYQKRNMARNAIAAYRHAERYHMDSMNREVWYDGYTMQELANHVTTLLYGREINPKKGAISHGT